MASIASCLITGQIARNYTLTGAPPPPRKVPGVPRGYEPNPWCLRPAQVIVMRALVKAKGNRKAAVEFCGKAYTSVKTQLRVCVAQMRVAGPEEAIEAFREWDALQAAERAAQ
jgi:hypothetical protein